MLRAFKNDNSATHPDNSFDTTGSFNNNEGCFNNNDRSSNTNSFNRTTVNYTTVDDRSEILAWLSPLEPQIRHRDIASRRVGSIGAWVLEAEEFKRWYKGSGGGGSYRPTLFCEGNPGVGKSHITSLVIDKLCDEATEGDPMVVCFYFDFAARNEQSPINMLGSLLRQLVSGGGIPEAIAQDFRMERGAIGGRRPQIPGILKMFQTIVAAKRAFICVDALDECVPENRMVLLGSLGEILQGSRNTRLFVTGRPHVRSQVERELGGAATFLYIRAAEDGVLRFLHEKLRKDTIPDMMSSTLEEDIMQIIPAISSETFLLASLHIEAILRGATVARRRKTLKSIKDGAGLGDVYGTTLGRIKAQDDEKGKLAMATLTWVCHSERPLKVDELCHALAVEIGETYFDPENVPSVGALLDYCQGLITVDAEASTVRSIHHTVQEYLCSQQGLFHNPHSTLAETCLTYLTSRQVSNITSDSLSIPQSVPFLRYSARYWGTHTIKDFSDHAKTLALELLDKYEAHISAVSLLEQVVHPKRRGGLVLLPLFSGLHCASFFGIVELVTALMNTGGCDINQQDCTGNTPLGWSAIKGHEGVVKILLEQQDIDPNSLNMDYRTPLGWAAANGHEGVVKLLLERENVDPNLQDLSHRTPLACAAVEGHEAVVKLLLERESVDPNFPEKTGNGPLGCAAIQGHEGVVKILLGRQDVDPNRPNEWGLTPLGCAACAGHEAVVKLLLERENVDPDRPNMNGNGPLGSAAIKGHEGVVKILLERQDVNPNRPNKWGTTPLGCAACEGHEAVVELLLRQENVDPDRPDKNGNGALGLAAAKGHEGVVKILLERQDVDPNRPNKYDRTPLACAALKGHEGVVRLLLERESVDPNRPDIDGDAPLGCAAAEGHMGVVKVLLQRQDVDPNRPNKLGSTPLGCAALKGHEGVVTLLLEREDVDPNRPDIDGDGPLGCAAIEGHMGVVKILLQRQDVDPSRPNKDDRTPLLSAAAHGHEGVVRLLQQRRSVDPNRQDTHTGTTLPDTAGEGSQVVQRQQVPNSFEAPDVRARRQGMWDVWKSRVFSSKRKKA